AMLSSIAYLWVAKRRAGVSPAPSSEASGEIQTVRRDASPALSALEAVTDKSISFGFLFLTVGIISGAVWANSAWGTYWSWDPKETWSLITCFIYALYLHCRLMSGRRRELAAEISVFSIVFVVFIY